MNTPIYEGKAKQIFAGTEPNTYLIRFKDDATAGNGEKHAVLDNKGVLNAAISNLIYRHLAQNGVPTHLIKVIGETDILVRAAKIIPLEVIVRNVAAGSFSKKYGVAEGSELKSRVVEFSLKDDSLGDPMLSPSHILALGIAAEEEIFDVTVQALKINELLTELFAKAGIRLIDFKVEFGKTDDGNIILCDEISPDSCRLWDINTNEKMDKDRFRRDLGNVMDYYAEVLRRLQAAI
ncbi:MAG: phosphoribosylaminoimidazolesuccinocarboxamide synthase [Oscillospiraceae bacterium]|jgi:phosphoribosylaminoimidazole-succinocarboxamide synthase|nr:phosphoribosylaminoimidazolesuccinocarboxamide synthase [Oscillospiraceae bacterium]